MEPGSEVIVPATLASAPVDGNHGFVLFYTEREIPAEPSGDESPGRPAYTERSAPIPARTEVALANGTVIQLRLALDVRFLNAAEVDEQIMAEGEEDTVTHVGFQPDQAVALHGRWEGNGLFTADVVYSGTRADYLDHVQRSPGMILFGGMACGGLGIVLLLAGAVARFFGG